MPFKRLVTSLNASFEDFVTGVENHDAVAKSAITDVRRAAARLKAQQGQLAAQTTRLAATEEALIKKRDRWQSRAAEFANSDAQQAMQCLRNRDAVEQELASTTEQLTRQRGLGDQLACNLAQVERRLAELQQRRIELSSREARTNVLTKTGGVEAGADIEELFERWEVSVLQGEYREGGVPGAGCSAEQASGSSADQLDNELSAQERDAQLREELERLRAAPDS